MTTLTKWTLQITALLVLGWLASIAGQWSRQVVNGNSSERLAQLQAPAELNEPVMVSALKPASDPHVR
ncbi:hypothetical protein IFR09_21155 [Pseudomonas syringae]|nr:hypothetical protein [Pseudomonas syringae]MBD8573744.1 hypothetical protein [Pseudomonas syringae]MBD8792593.1 hypothetical protein [Pseudomonas syringae]MBD8802997.1 hypothetical protein [Pseudomonas syringae]MBD8813673.1 hypothetical protein [Pseudomonas syringae]